MLQGVTLRALCAWLFCFACLLPTLKSVKADPTPLPKDVQALLPVGTTSVDVMQVSLPAHTAEIARRLQTFAKAHPEIIQEMAQKAGTGKPMTYDARTGLSEAEYKEFATTRPRLKKVGQAIITIKAQSTRRIFDGGKTLPGLTGVQVDLQQGKVTTPLGSLAQYTVIRPHPNQAPGAWAGVAWTQNTVGRMGFFPNQVQQGHFIKIGLGKVQQTGKGLFFYRVEQIENKTLQQKLWVAIEFNLPRAAQ